MLCTGEALEEFLQAFQALLIIGISVAVVSTLLERILENFPMQWPIARIDAIGVGGDDVFDLGSIEQVVDFRLQAGGSNFLASGSPGFRSDARGLGMLGCLGLGCE